MVTLVVASWVRRLTLRHFEGHDQGDEVAVQSTAKLLAGIVVLRVDWNIRPRDVVEVHDR